MLIIKVVPGESIEKVLKKYKRKVRNTKQLKRLKDMQNFTKKSIEKRERKKKAIYKNEYLIKDID